MPDATPAPLLDQVNTLHGAVREWSAPYPQNLPYIDLLFAFAYAELGEPAAANRLVEAARGVMAVPVPESPSPRHDQRVVATVVTNFLFKAFQYRIDQALAGQPHAGSLSQELLDELAGFRQRGETGWPNNTYMLADYVIGRLREWSVILEPQDRIDVYAEWSKSVDSLKKELGDLHAIHEPDELAGRIRKLLTNGVPGKSLNEVRFGVLREALPLAPRVGEPFAIELLQLVPDALAGADGRTSGFANDAWAQSKLFQPALTLADYYGRAEIVTALIDQLASLVAAHTKEQQLRLVSIVGAQFLRIMTKFNLRDALDRFTTLLDGVVLRGMTLAEVREKPTRNPNLLDERAAVLQAELHLAGGRLALEKAEQAAPILEAARHELLDRTAAKHETKEFVAIARAYVNTLGQSPPAIRLASLTELFQKMDRWKITNNWTTAQYFSRFHLELVEDVVLALRGLGPEPALRVTASA